MKIYRYMMMARKEAIKSQFKQHQLGAVIEKGNSVLSKGNNKLRHCATGKKYAPWEVSIHAERDACRKVDKDSLKGSTIYVYREYANGQTALALPCDDCFLMIKELGIKRIVFSQPEFPFYGIIKL